MSVESATFVADLQPANPPSTDPRAQGDDHLRLIKQVLQNTFGSATRQIQFPSTLALSATTTLTKAQGESMVYVNTGGGPITLTLPSLVAGDAGWKIRLCKTSSDANPMFIAPPSGTLSSGGIAGLSKARRCIPGVPITAIWDGAAWFVTRAGVAPIGTMLDYAGASLPAGFEWASGTPLSSAANYPEYNAVVGGLATPDMRGRVGIPLDNLGGSAAGRLSGGIIAGSTLGATGGVDATSLGTTNLPAHQHGVFVTKTETAHSHPLPAGAYQNSGSAAGITTAGVAQGISPNITATSTATTGITVSVGSGAGLSDNQTASVGSGTAFANLPPAIMITKLLVVE